MVTMGQLRTLLGDGLDYQAARRRLGIPVGQAYLIATGVLADGSDTIPDQEMAQCSDVLASSQHLANPRHENPTSRGPRAGVSRGRRLPSRAQGKPDERAMQREKVSQPGRACYIGGVVP